MKSNAIGATRQVRQSTLDRWLAEVDEPQAVERPYHALGIAVLECAINDYQLLQRAGLVEGATVREDRWKRQEAKNPTGFRHYSNMQGPIAARQLIAFFMDGGWDDLASILDFNVSAEKVCRELGMLE